MKALAIVAAVVITILVIVAGVTALFGRAECAIYGYQTDRNTKYAAFVGCMVDVDGKWIPRRELRVTQ